jgi:D-alanyl-D-alanine carboxypeptidase
VILSLQVRLSDLITAVGTDIKQLRTWITGSSSGNLTGLTTTAKTDIVAAINEVNAKPSGSPPDATVTVKGIVELATLAEVGTGTDTVRAVTPEGVRQERTALKAEILGAGVPAALDTLDELAAALADDANYAASTATALANRLRIDINNQGLTGTQQTNGQTNLGVYSTTQLGDPETDLVALYTTAKA